MGSKKGVIVVVAMLILSLLLVQSASAAVRTVKLTIPGCE